MNNNVENYIIKLDKDLEKTDLIEITNFINSHFEQLEFSEISKKIRKMLKQKELGNTDKESIAKSALELISSIMVQDGEEKKNLECID
jgi:transcriptional regulator of heat shock response